VIAGIDLDHVALAVERHALAWPRYAGQLGAHWCSGGEGVGFAPAQVAFEGGMRVEILAPARVERNDFLRRFLDHNGPGPHHLTFKVADLRSALDELQAAGYRPVAVDLESDPHWLEAFLHPREAMGIVIQLAQASGPPWQSPTPEGYPAPPPSGTATLVHVAHCVRDFGAALALFSGILGGTEVGRGRELGARWIDLRWPGPGRIRLLEPDGPDSPLVAWTGDRAGRLHHLAFFCRQPSAVTGAGARMDGSWEVPPEANFGTRLLLATPGTENAFAAVDQG
jgi:methylmalonyl-CoA/ethylmalonyl-CoA epimerase